VPKRLTRAQAERLYERLSASRPDPRTELDFVNPYTLLVAVVLSAQATDRSVNQATAPLFKSVQTPEAMVKLGEARLAAYIKTIGLWRNKAKNVIALSKLLIDKHMGQVPNDRDALEALPGVGRKTANVVLLEAFGEGAIAVDTHVFRVANRSGLAFGKDPREVEDGLMKITPPRFLRGAHHWLILHGRYICLARTPGCWRCVISDICTYPNKTPDPATQAKTKAKKRK
jgi:endonuclease-3